MGIDSERAEQPVQVLTESRIRHVVNVFAIILMDSYMLQKVNVHDQSKKQSIFKEM